MLNISVYIDLDDDFVTINKHPYLKFSFLSEGSIKAIKENILKKVEEHLLPENLIKNNDAHKKEIILEGIQRNLSEIDILPDGEELSFSAGNYDINIRVERPKQEKAKTKRKIR